MSTSIEIIKRELVGTIELNEGASDAFLMRFAAIAMEDAALTMDSNKTTKATYQATDVIGTTEITIQHTPETFALPQMTVSEAKTALREAQRREREQDTPVAMYED